jgi:hypothetical protein
VAERGLPAWRFILRSALVWVLMVLILVVLPDALDGWLSIEVGRVVGWAVACGVWVVIVEQEWKSRFGPFTRFVLQLVIWVAAAVLAMWIGDSLRLTR